MAGKDVAEGELVLKLEPDRHWPANRVLKCYTQIGLVRWKAD